MNNNILITGGLGYIGSHICMKLLSNQYNIFVIDRLSTHKKKILTSLHRFKNFNFIEGDMNQIPLKYIMQTNNIDTVIHCAGKKDFSQSWNKPNEYIAGNVILTKSLLDNLPTTIKNFIFLSTCMVYGNQQLYKETITPLPQSPYAKSKHIQENLIVEHSNKNNYHAAILRVFNPIGYQENLGEDIYNSQMIVPAILRCLISESKTFNIYGNQFNTIDGTTVRDYIHIEDLTLFVHNYFDKYLDLQDKVNFWNVGSSHGVSVEELLSKCETLSKTLIKRNYVQSRQCDNPSIIANIEKAKTQLSWKPQETIENALKSSLFPYIS